ncbi:uncharacterized protein LOC128337667 isoform X2 [Hemicordylus capensis]|uniref:uncharacterized protein LOC128337667 isoform X2 n=1 Tax=Hemicordylus capensis TaxID=884348 RepID=UPI002303C578|nr:uncharacterized protein LOC128337667 isoform X2 [Hemicordylus capensis]
MLRRIRGFFSRRSSRVAPLDAPAEPTASKPAARPCWWCICGRKNRVAPAPTVLPPSLPPVGESSKPGPSAPPVQDAGGEEEPLLGGMVGQKERGWPGWKDSSLTVLPSPSLPHSAASTPCHLIHARLQRVHQVRTLKEGGGGKERRGRITFLMALIQACQEAIWRGEQRLPFSKGLAAQAVLWNEALLGSKNRTKAHLRVNLLDEPHDWRRAGGRPRKPISAPGEVHEEDAASNAR